MASQLPTGIAALLGFLAGPKPICCKWKNNKIKGQRERLAVTNRNTKNPAKGPGGKFRNKPNEKLGFIIRSRKKRIRILKIVLGVSHECSHWYLNHLSCAATSSLFGIDAFTYVLSSFCAYSNNAYQHPSHIYAVPKPRASNKNTINCGKTSKNRGQVVRMLNMQNIWPFYQRFCLHYYHCCYCAILPDTFSAFAVFLYFQCCGRCSNIIFTMLRVASAKYYFIFIQLQILKDFICDNILVFKIMLNAWKYLILSSFTVMHSFI